MWPCQLIGARRAVLSLSQAELTLSLSCCTLIVVWMQRVGMCNEDVLMHVMEWNTCGLHRLLTRCRSESHSHSVYVHLRFDSGMNLQLDAITQTSKSHFFTDMTDNNYTQIFLLCIWDKGVNWHFWQLVLDNCKPLVCKIKKCRSKQILVSHCPQIQS